MRSDIGYKNSGPGKYLKSWKTYAAVGLTTVMLGAQEGCVSEKHIRYRENRAAVRKAEEKMDSLLTNWDKIPILTENQLANKFDQYWKGYNKDIISLVKFYKKFRMKKELRKIEHLCNDFTEDHIKERKKRVKKIRDALDL